MGILELQWRTVYRLYCTGQHTVSSHDDGCQMFNTQGVSTVGRLGRWRCLVFAVVWQAWIWPAYIREWISSAFVPTGQCDEYQGTDSTCPPHFMGENCNCTVLPMGIQYETQAG